jgi:AraC-like DNA-binding protein/Ca2+/Na+ antiporter
MKIKHINNEIIATFICVSLFLLFLPCYASAKKVADKSQRDVDLVYEYTFTDINKAKKIMDEMRRNKERPEYELNLIEGDLYFNRGKYFEALRLYKRAYHDKSLDEKKVKPAELLRRIIMSYDGTRNNTMALYYSHQLLKRGNEANDNAMKSIATFSIGKIIHFKGEKQKGIMLMKEAIQMMKKSKFRAKYDQLYYDYITLVGILQDDQRNMEALNLLRGMAKDMKQEKDQSKRPIDMLDSSRYKDVYAHCAVLLQRLGKTREAAEYYKKFVSSGQEYAYDYTCILPYMRDRKLYNDMIKFAEARQQYLRSLDDTLGYDMTTVCQMQAEGFTMKGEYRKAAQALTALNRIVNSIKTNEEVNAITELSSNYEIHDKEMEMEHKATRLKIASIMVIVMIIFIFVGIIIYRTIRYNKVITHKNMLMAKTIDDLINYREQLNAHDNAMEKARAEGDDDDDTDGDEQVQRQMFERMKHEIIDKRLYLNPDISRDLLLEKLNIPKNEFSHLFKEYANTSYTKFINELRLDHAVKMLRQFPNYTIESIAAESGISSVTTLYKLFSNKFGMTPTEYRSTLLKKMVNDDDEMAE